MVDSPHVSSEVLHSLSSPESTMVSQCSSTSLSKVLCPEGQSWNDLGNNSSPGEEVDFQLSAVSVKPQDTDHLLTDCNKTMENDRAEPECGFQNSLSEDGPKGENDQDNLAGPGKATLRTLPKGEPSRSWV